MNLIKYKITATKTPGYMIVLYQDGHFKSILNEFKPPLTEKQLNVLLNLIPDDHEDLIALINANGYRGKIIAERIKGIGSEPELEGMSANLVIALFCEFYEAKTRIKYKVSAPDAGKISQLKAQESEWYKLFQTYFDSDNFLFKNKYCISNLVKYYNELRLEAFGKPAGKSYPIPYDAGYFKTLDYTEQRAYWAALREAGYVFEKPKSGEGSWVKKNNLINQ
jgi:hypothetical protein